MKSFVFLNDSFVDYNEAKLHISDLAIQRGYGIFDYLKTIDRVPILIQEHLDRFFNSAKALHLPVRLGIEELRNTIYKLIQKNTISISGMRLTLTGGFSEDGYSQNSSNLFITQQPLTLPSADAFDKGINLMSIEHSRQLPSVKTIDYLKAISLQPILREARADDVLYYNKETITECPRANFFIVNEGNIIVTPANDILHGITRMKILEFAKKDFKIEIRDVPLEEIKFAKEAFITSTTKGILPVSQINNHIISTTPGPVTATLNNSLKSLIKEYQDLQLSTNSTKV